MLYTEGVDDEFSEIVVDFKKAAINLLLSDLTSIKTLSPT